MDSSGAYEGEFEKETGESASKSAVGDSKVPETTGVNKASPGDGVSGPPVADGDVPNTTGDKSKGVDEADSSAISDELLEDEMEPVVSLRDSGIGLEPQSPSPTTEEPEPQVAEESPVVVEDTPTQAEPAPLDSQPAETPVEEPNTSNDDTKPQTSDTAQHPTPKPDNEPQADLQAENDGLKEQLKAMRGDYEEKVGILELQLDGEKEKVEEQARRIKELQKLLRKQQDDDLASQGSGGDIKEKAKAAASLKLERDFLVRQYNEGKTTEECLRQTITDMLEEKEKDEQKIKDLDVRLQRAAKDHEAKDKRMAQLQDELRDVTALVTQLEEHMDKVKVEEARRNIKATKEQSAAVDSSVTNNEQSRVCTIL